MCKVKIESNVVCCVLKIGSKFFIDCLLCCNFQRQVHVNLMFLCVMKMKELIH